MYPFYTSLWILIKLNIYSQFSLGELLDVPTRKSLSASGISLQQARAVLLFVQSTHKKKTKFMNEIVKLRKRRKKIFLCENEHSTENSRSLKTAKSFFIIIMRTFFSPFSLSLFSSTLKIFKTENKIYYVSTVAATYVLKARKILFCSVCTHQFGTETKRKLVNEDGK